jgi:hypothetical protein
MAAVSLSGQGDRGLDRPVERVPVSPFGDEGLTRGCRFVCTPDRWSTVNAF